MLPLLEVAVTWRKPPLTVVAGRPDTWRTDDSLLAAAYLRYKSERVGPSGIPLRVAGDVEDADSWVVDEDTIDYAQTALNQWQADRDSKSQDAVLPRVRFHRTIKPWER